MDADVAAEQLTEIEALQSIYASEGEFELLVPPGAGGEAACFRVRCPPPVGSVLVTLPRGYPSSESPTFVAENLRGLEATAFAESLAELASARLGDVCVFEVLSEAEEVAARAGISAAPAADAAGAADAPASGDESNGPAAWLRSDERGAILQLSVRSGPKVKATQISNLSELRRIKQTSTVCVDVAPSRNTENYELAALLAARLAVKPDEVEFLVGGKREKATGERQALILGLSAEELMQRFLDAD
eukprot:TRINITY_DN68534_c0_g1_i1.p1 TRINITY_DN68534_c0_g1~~TRINITY_DN68534_c0_g1_i1.p1  ORF type:complete len:270 (+),score=70.92 TRINITY_DN68534_c0_g1_i1:71-811(+)